MADSFPVTESVYKYERNFFLKRNEMEKIQYHQQRKTEESSLATRWHC